MSKKLIWGDFSATHAVKVYRDSEWQEYVARLIDKRTGKAYEPADYFTNDKEDAISSARDMLRRASAAHVKTNPKARKKRNPAPRSGIRIVHNKLLGGWYVVRGPHQTPLNGRFDSKEAAREWLRMQQTKRNPDIHIDIGSHNATKSRRVRTNPDRENFPVPLSMAEVKERNQAAGLHWFEPATIRFFKTRIVPRSFHVGGNSAYFASRETDPSKRTAFTVRVAHRDGRIETVGEFMGYKTISDVKAAVKAAAYGLPLRKNPEPARMRRKHAEYQVQRSDNGDRWIRLADFPHTPDGKALAIQYAKAYHNAKRCMVRVID